MSDSKTIEGIRRSVGLFGPFPRAVLHLEGKDRHLFLHRLLTQDIRRLSPGQGTPACLLDRLGKIQFAGFLHEAADKLILELDPSQLDTAKSLLEKYLIAEEVRIEDSSHRYTVLPLHGPKTLPLLEKTFPKLTPPGTTRHHTPGPPGSGIHFAARTDLLRINGVHLWIEPERQDEIRRSLIQAGQPFNLQLAGWETFETLRIEAGIPWPGHELNDSVILNELADEDWISFTKGCFIGQEIVARIKYRAHPPRVLTGFLVEGNELPPPSSPLYLDGTQAGILTSACISPTLNRVIALGFLKYGVEGSSYEIQTPSNILRAKATPLPFVG